MDSVFVDTGYLIALEALDDQHHEEAIGHWSLVAPKLRSITTTTYVFDEVVTFFNSRGHHEKAVGVGSRLLESEMVEMVRVDKQLFQEGWRLFKSRPDKRFSLTDCISFVVMERRKLWDALAFDRHFVQAGYRIWPSGETESPM